MLDQIQNFQLSGFLTNRDRYAQTDGYSSRNSDSSLSVVIRCEQGWVLKRAVGWESLVCQCRKPSEGGLFLSLPPTRVSSIPRNMALRSKCEISNAFFNCALSMSRGSSGRSGRSGCPSADDGWALLSRAAMLHALLRTQI